jgi:hypothetical protein
VETEAVQTAITVVKKKKPLTHVVRGDLRAAIQAHRERLEEVRGIERVVDAEIATARAVVQECATALLAHAVGSPSWRSAFETLAKAMDAHFKAWELQVPFLRVAKQVEAEGAEFLRHFADTNS